MKGWVKILIGLAGGLAFGIIVGEQFKILAVTGKIFIDLLKMLVGILVFSSIVTGICHINDPKKLGRIGLRAITFYVATTFIAICLGIGFAYLFQPGSGLNLFHESMGEGDARRLGALDFITSMVPSNPFASLVEGNILQVIVFAVFFAFAITLTGEKAKPVSTFFESITEVMNSLTHMIMKMAPIGVFALIATSVGELGVGVVWPLAKFLGCNLFACFFQVACVFTIAIRLLARTEIMPFFKGMKDAMVLAFTTSSSAATLPVTMECAREELGISDDISGFVLALGSTVNMNGAAIGQAISCIFIAQAYGIELTMFKIIVLIVTSLLSAIGAAGIPGQGIVMLSIVLNSIGLPLEGIALVAGVDRIREMISTVVNVLGDAVAAMYVARKENQVNVDKYSTSTWLTSRT